MFGGLASLQHGVAQIRLQGAGADDRFGLFESCLFDQAFDCLEQSLAFVAGHSSAPRSGHLDRVEGFFRVSLGAAKTVINPAAGAFIAQGAKNQLFKLVNPGLGRREEFPVSRWNERNFRGVADDLDGIALGPEIESEL